MGRDGRTRLLFLEELMFDYIVLSAKCEIWRWRLRDDNFEFQRYDPDFIRSRYVSRFDTNNA